MSEISKEHVRSAMAVLYLAILAFSVQGGVYLFCFQLLHTAWAISGISLKFKEHTYIHTLDTYVHTCIHTLDTYMHTYITYICAYMHTYINKIHTYVHAYIHYITYTHTLQTDTYIHYITYTDRQIHICIHKKMHWGVKCNVIWPI